MSLLLKSLTLHNFLSHADTHIDFEENEHILLDGNSGDGKSSIIEAITWALFGEGRVPNAKLIRNGQSDTRVILAIKWGSDTFTITRSCSRRGKHDLGVQRTSDASSGDAGETFDVRGVRDAQEFISKHVLGSSRALFLNSAAYLQGGETSFVSQSAARRKDILLEIIEGVDLDSYSERTKKAIAEREWQHNSHVEGIKALSKEILEDKAKSQGMDKIKEELFSLGEEEKKLSKEVERYRERQVRLQSALEQAKSLEALVASYLEGVDHLTERKDRAERAAFELNELEGLGGVLIGTINRLSEAEKTMREAESKAQEVEQKRRKEVEYLQTRPEVENNQGLIAALQARLKKGFDHTCPAGDACPHEADFAREERSTKKQLKELQDLAAAQALELAKWEAGRAQFYVDELNDSVLISARREVERLKDEVRRIEIKLGEKERLEKEAEALLAVSEKLARTKAELKEAQEKKKELDVFEAVSESAMLQQKIGRAEAKMKVNRESSEMLLSELSKRQTYFDRIAVREKEKRDLQKSFKKVDGELKKLVLLKEAFGSKGIKTIVVDHILPSLEDKVNEILSGLSTHTVSFETQIEKSSGEGNKEGLWIIIRDELGHEMDFESLSGGEKSKVTVAIAEALATLQRCGWRMFDEFVTALDEDSLEQFMEAIGYLQKKYPQILIVSHIRGIKDAFENKMLVSKHNGVSSLKRVK